MASGQVPPVLNEGPPMVDVKHLFFKARPSIQYFPDAAEADSIDNGAAFQQFSRSLECSNKYGCLLMSFNNSLYLIRVHDILAAQNSMSGVENSGPLRFTDLKILEIKNSALPETPNIISLSNGEEYLAVDTVRGGAACVVIFRMSDFINQGGSSLPFCEIRCPSSSPARISSICWNPGENMGNMFAVNADDGSLYLAKINGQNNVELNKFPQGGVRCLCWSPKGKQLVIGRSSGNLSQLKLDLTEAKQIPGPGPDTVPISILWTHTTQFLIVFQKEGFIDFMQLDLAKNAPPTFSNSGDIFVSDMVPQKCSCYFLPFMPWNAVIGVTNSASDLVVLVKVSMNQSEMWTPGDITDNRRAAFLLDNYAKGAAVYYGCMDPVMFSEVELYPSMPMIFLLSQRGSISVYSVVNCDPQAPSLNTKVALSVPDSIFSNSAKRAATTATVAPQLPIFQPPSGLSVSTALSAPFPINQQSFHTLPNMSIPLAVNPPAQPARLVSSIQPNIPNTFLQSSSQKPVLTQKSESPIPPAPQTVPSKLDSFVQQPSPRQLATSTLPTAQDMAILQKTVEEKRREMTSQLQTGTLKGLEDDDQCAFVMAEIRKFEQRLADFKLKIHSNTSNLNALLSSSFSQLEKNVLTALNSVEDFVSGMVSTTSAQKEEVDVLKERILNHFSQLEYAKSIVERSRDPRYLEHLRSRPLDPASRQKFQDIRKLHNYITNQVAECRRFFYEQSRKKETSLDRISPTQLIYLTLANHSQIIRRLNSELDKIKLQLGLGKHVTAFDEAEFVTVREPKGSGKNRENTPANSASNDDLDEITLTDLTAGISRVKLNRDSNQADRKPIKFANRKLMILQKTMSRVSVVKVKADQTPWTRTPSKPSRPKSVAYPTASFETSFSKMMESAAPAESERLLHTSVAASSGLPKVAFENLAPGNTSFMGFTTASIKPSATLPSGINLNSTSPNTTVLGKIGETMFTTPVTYSQSPAVTSSIKSVTSVGTKSNSGISSVASPPAEMPTLRGLLSTPPTSTSNLISSSFASSPKTPTSFGGTGLFSSTSSPFSNPNPSSTSIFGSGAFTLGTQSTSLGFNKSVTSTTTTANNNNPVMIAPMVNLPSPAIGLDLSSSTSVRSQASLPFVSIGIASSTTVTSSTSSLPPPSAFINTASAEPTNIFGTTAKGSTALNFGANTITSNVTSTTKTSTTSSGLFTSPIVSSSTTPVTGLTEVKEMDKNNLFSVSTPTSGGLFSTPASFTISGTKLFGSNSSSSVISLPSETTPKSSSMTTSAGDTLVSSPSSVVPGTAAVSSAIVIPQLATVPSGGSVSSPPAPIPTADKLASSTTTSTTPNIFGGLGLMSFGTTSTSGGLFGSATTTTASGTSNLETGVFDKAAAAGPGDGLFAVTSTPSTTSSGLFSSIPVTTSSTGLFSLAASTSAPSGFFQTSTTGTSSTPAVGFMSSLNISDSTNKTASTATGGLFSTPAFGSSQTPASNIFGGANTTLGSQNQTTSGPTSGIFSLSSATATQNSQGFGFGQTAPTNSSGFGNPSGGASVFGGAATFGSASPFGSSFGSTAAPAFGSGVFGSAATTTTTQSTGFGTLPQSNNTPSAFGGSPFGSGGQQQASVFGSPTQQKPTTTGGLFSSTFGSPTATPAGNVFGGGGSVFGGNSTGSGAFSAGGPGGGVAQQGFGFGQSKPPTASVFGSPSNTGATPAAVFGGGATFGSSSPFGSSFGSSPTQAFGSPASGSVFGGTGTATNQTGGFGALAQQGSTSPGFVAASAGGGFGAVPQQSSPFGPSAQQEPKPVFGGQAFSSWR